MLYHVFMNNRVYNYTPDSNVPQLDGNDTLPDTSDMTEYQAEKINLVDTNNRGKGRNKGFALNLKK